MNSVTTLMTSHNTEDTVQLPTYSTDHELCHNTDDVTQHCRYTEWVGFNNLTGVADWSTTVGKELYEETLGRSCGFDTDSVNVAADPVNAGTVADLHALLRSIV
jgi:hypothetical protein